MDKFNGGNKMNKGEIFRSIVKEALTSDDVDILRDIAGIMGMHEDINNLAQHLVGKVEKQIKDYERYVSEDNFVGSKWKKYEKANNEKMEKEVKNAFPFVFAFTEYIDVCTVENNLVKAILLDLLFSMANFDTKSKVFLNYKKLNNEHVYNNLRDFVFEEGLPSSQTELKKKCSIKNLMVMGVSFVPQLKSECFEYLLREVRLRYDNLLSFFLLGHLIEDEESFTSKVLLTEADRISILNIITNDVIKMIVNMSKDGLSAVSNTQAELYNVMKLSTSVWKEREKIEKEMAVLQAKYNEKINQYNRLKESISKGENVSEYMSQIASLNKEVKNRNEDIEDLKEIIEKQQAEIDRLLLRENIEVKAEDIEINPKIKILIAGGKAQSVAYVKELCPLSKAIVSETTPLNSLEVNTFDIVLYFNDFSNHCITKRVKKYTDSEIKNVHIKQVYCYSTNKEQIKRTIYEATKDIKKD